MVALAIPLTLAIVFAVMQALALDLQRISLGALIIALTLLVDDAMTTVDSMMRRLAAGDHKEVAATYAYRTLAGPMLAGTLITIAGFVPIGFAKSAASEYTFSIFAVVAISLIVSWFVAVIFAPLIGLVTLKAPNIGGAAPETGRAGALVQRVPHGRAAREVAGHRPYARGFRSGDRSSTIRSQPVLSGVRPPGADGRS